VKDKLVDYLLAASLVLFIAGLFSLPVIVPWGVCTRKADAMGVRSSWGPIQGCMIEIKGQWVPLDNYRVL
jgi:hypothetical protein